jgi:hypothetical protein
MQTPCTNTSKSTDSGDALQLSFTMLCQQQFSFGFCLDQLFTRSQQLQGDEPLPGSDPLPGVKILLNACASGRVNFFLDEVQT